MRDFSVNICLRPFIFADYAAAGRQPGTPCMPKSEAKKSKRRLRGAFKVHCLQLCTTQFPPKGEAPSDVSFHFAGLTNRVKAVGQTISSRGAGPRGSAARKPAPSSQGGSPTQKLGRFSLGTISLGGSGPRRNDSSTVSPADYTHVAWEKVLQIVLHVSDQHQLPV